MLFPNFRLAMAWVHTWFGLVLGFVLMACFFFGTLSVFDREIDRWAVPSTRFEPRPMPSFDQLLRPAFERIQPAKEEAARLRAEGQDLPDQFGLDKVVEWGVYATHRDPVLGLWAGFAAPTKDEPDESIWGNSTIDPRSGALVPDSHLKIGSGFFYPLHFNLHFTWLNLGYWIVGLAALVMLAALVSGVVMHRKFFREFFTFRPRKAMQRSTLDLHNMSGVLALPFHFFFAFTGLMIFGGIYFPVTHTQLHDLHELHEKLDAQETGLPAKRAGIAAPLASVDAMMAEAQRRWAAKGMPGEVGFMAVRHVGDVNGYVMVYRAGTDRVVKFTGEGVYFKASTGEVLRESPAATPVESVSEFLSGLHLQHFRHWLLRWLYVVGGLLGCVCIATGFIFFVEKRKKQHAKAHSQGSRVVDALAVTTVTGMVIAAVTMLLANRVLPADLAGKGDWESAAFWSAWALALAHAYWRSAPVAQARLNPAWREQCGLLALLAVGAAIANWVSTGDHLIKTLWIDPYWPVAGVDLSLLAMALLSLLAMRHLRKASHV